jgi:hypothetical protein
MNYKTFKMTPIRLALLAAGLGMAQASFAADLVAIEGQWSPDGGTTQIPMWGFARDTGQACDSLPNWDVGPQLTDADLVGGDLTIKLRNCLSEPVSIVIPGQPTTYTPQTTVDSTGRTRITAFTHEAMAAGDPATYTWTGVRPGTYLYQSGSHPAKQVQMGLYGALTVGSYPDATGDVTLLYSEIDPALHSPPAAAKPLNYNPRYFLVNGVESQPAAPVGDGNGSTVVLRMLNAGLDFHVPMLSSGYLTQVAEDGNPYPYSKQQYSVNLAAGKTIDALWQPADGDYVIYDRRGNNMPVQLTVNTAADVTPPVVTILGPNPAEVVVGTPYVDAGATAYDLVDGDLTTAMRTSFNLRDTNTVGMRGSFTYDVSDKAGNRTRIARTVIVVADTIAPEITVLGANPTEVLFDSTYTDAGAEAIDNVDGVVAVTSSGSVDTATPGPYLIEYSAVDSAGNPVTASRTVNVLANRPPAGSKGVVTVKRNSPAVFINLADNVSDPDGNLKDGNGHVLAGQITLTTGSRTSKRGTVTVLTDGVNYTPRTNFRGTDTFKYTVTDLAGAVSEEIKVRINVIK